MNTTAGLRMGNLLPKLRPRLEGAADGHAWRALESLAEELPPAWGWGCFEVRLRAGEGRVDLLVWAQGDPGRRALAAALAQGRLPSGEGVRPVLEDWIGPGTPLSRFPVVWLEYDLPEAGVRPPFVAFGVQHGRGSGPLPPPLAPAEWRSLAGRSRALLAEGSAGEDRLDAIEHCAGTLPPGGRINYLAWYLPSRPSEDARLLAALPTAAAWDWLQAIAWPGERRHWDLARALLGADYPAVQLNVDVGSGVLPRLGVELQQPSEARGPWSIFLQRLVDVGIANSDRCALVLDWLGRETVRLPGAEWPVRIERHAVVKVDVDPEGSLAAKAYLFFHAGHTLF